MITMLLTAMLGFAEPVSIVNLEEYLDKPTDVCQNFQAAYRTADYPNTREESNFTRWWDDLVIVEYTGKRYAIFDGVEPGQRVPYTESRDVRRIVYCNKASTD